jgi:hypothetical protein
VTTAGTLGVLKGRSLYEYDNVRDQLHLANQARHGIGTRGIFCDGYPEGTIDLVPVAIDGTSIRMAGVWLGLFMTEFSWRACTDF